MKKILKIIAIIIVILALLLLLQALVSYLGGPNILGMAFGETSWLGSLSTTGLIILSTVGLVIAAIISPSGFKKALDRVTSSIRKVGEAGVDMATAPFKGLFDGLKKAVGGSFNLLLLAAAGAAVYAFWPARDSDSSRSRLAMDLNINRESNEELQSLHHQKG